MAILPMLDGPVFWALLCLACPAVTVFIVLKSIKKPNAQSGQMPHGGTPPPRATGNADHQVSRAGRVLGTHSEPELRQLLASGHYLPTDFYWKPGMPSWAPLSSLPSQAANPVAPGASAASGQRLAIQGTILSFNIQQGVGLISGYNGFRYNFIVAQWGSPTLPPSVGLAVEFEANGTDAENIYPAAGRAGAQTSGDFYRSSDNVIVAGVCAGLAHKWNSDPVLIRIAMVFVPFGWIFYIIGSMSWSARPTRGMNP